MSSGLELALLVREVVQLHRQLGAAMAAQLGLHPSDLQALDELAADQPIGPSELGRRLGLGSAAATALTDRLERAGHVQRTPHPDDRRRITLAPTAHAQREAGRVLGPYLTELTAAADALPERDREVIADYLREVARICRRHLEASSD